MKTSYNYLSSSRERERKHERDANFSCNHFTNHTSLIHFRFGFSISFIRVRVEDAITGWLNNSALRVVEFSVKGAGTDEDTWYEDNQGQVQRRDICSKA